MANQSEAAPWPEWGETLEQPRTAPLPTSKPSLEDAFGRKREPLRTLRSLQAERNRLKLQALAQQFENFPKLRESSLSTQQVRFPSSVNLDSPVRFSEQSRSPLANKKQPTQATRELVQPRYSTRSTLVRVRSSSPRSALQSPRKKQCKPVTPQHEKKKKLTMAEAALVVNRLYTPRGPRH